MMDKKTIELTRTFQAPIAILFTAIKNGELLRCTGVKAESFKHDFRVNGEFSLEWSCKTAGTCTGRYVKIIPNEVVQFTWNSSGCAGATSSETTVTVTLKDLGHGTLITLVHEGLDAGFSYEDHLAGWTSSIDDFVAFLEQPLQIS